MITLAAIAPIFRKLFRENGILPNRGDSLFSENISVIVFSMILS
jgi:hypothetical protein